MLPYELVNEKIVPIYEEVKGWSVPLNSTAGDSLPAALEGYIQFLEKELRVPITLVSTGPDRLQTIFRESFSM
jgi:adenylosuccinate synthase